MSAYSTVISAESSLVSFWKLDETSGTSAADSKGANTGTYTGGFTLAQAPIPGDVGGGSVKLNGSTGYVAIGTPTTNLPTTGAYSMEVWVQIPAGTTMTTSQGIIGYGNYGSNNAVNALKFLSAPTAVQNYWWANDQTWTLLKDIRDALWHHLVATYDATNRYFYMDGTLVAAGVAASSHNATQQNLRLGNTNSTEFFPTNGLLTNCAIYNAALSQSQVSQHWGIGIGKLTIPWRAPPATRTIHNRNSLQFFVPCSEVLPTDVVENRIAGFTGGSVNPSIITSPWGNALHFTLNSKQLTWQDQRTSNREGPYTLFALCRLNSALDVSPNRAGIVSTGTASTGALGLQYSASNGNEICLLKAGATVLCSPKLYAQFGDWCAIAVTWDGKSLHHFYVYDMETGLYQTADVTDTNLSAPSAISPSIASAPSSGYLDGDMVVAGIDRVVWSQSDFGRFIADPFYPMRRTPSLGALATGAGLFPTSAFPAALLPAM